MEEKLKNLHSYRQNAGFFFKLSIKYANKRLYKMALKYLYKAIEIEPYNADYNLNLACILTEMNDIRQSNDVLLGILQNIDPTLSECYFGIGCNYFDLGELKKAREYFEKYVHLDPDGQFADETYDILYYLQLYSDETLDTNKSKTISRLSSQAKKLLDKGDYQKACSKLEKLIEMDPWIIPPRNNLSVAYFFTQQIDKAISLAKSALKLEPENVFANCNLALFYACSGRLDLYSQQLKVLKELTTNDRQDFFKLLDTYIILCEHHHIIGAILEYLKKAREPYLYQLVPIAFYNLKYYDDADRVWKELARIFPQYNLVTGYYSTINMDTRAGLVEHSEMKYTVKLPESLDEMYRNKLDLYMQLDSEVFKKKWAKDRDIKDIVLYYMFEGNNDLKLVIITKLKNCNLLQQKNSKVRRVLKGLLNEADIDKGVKCAVADVLNNV